MKTIIKLLAVFALMVATFSHNTSASAGGGGGTFKFKGQSASAYFSSADPSGCIYTDVSVYASEQISASQPGPGSPSSGTNVSIYQYDACTGTQLLAADGFAPLADADFEVSKKLESAKLNATVNVFDYVSGTSFDVSLDLTWTGTSSLGHQMSHFQYQFAGCHQNLHTNGTFRFAQAIGAVSAGTTEFAPSPAVDASIFSAKSGDVSTGCN